MKRLTLMTGIIAVVLSAATILHAEEITIRGKLQKTVEAGGWLVVEREGKKYLILNSREFTKHSWFKESTNVEAVGETKDVMTTFMEGTPFEAKSIKPLDQAVATPGSDNRRVTRVNVVGDSIVQAQPDTAIITISVVTQARRALEAQQENAAKSDAVVRALKTAAGTGAEVKTSGYSVQPMRVYRENQPPTITGYEARNSVTVTLGELNRVGPVIDAAAQAGANDVSGIAFTLRQDRQAKDRALNQATQEAMSKARVIAQALGGRVVRVVEVQEEGFIQRPPQPLYQMEAGKAMRDAVATPIEIGSLDITSRVQLIAEVETM